MALVPGENILGRESEEGGIRIDSKTVSRRHARIVVSGSSASLEDLDSKNGTYLRGQSVTTAVALNDGDEIRIGAVVLRFRMASGSRTASWSHQQHPVFFAAGAAGTEEPHPHPAPPVDFTSASRAQHASVPPGAGPPQHAAAVACSAFVGAWGRRACAVVVGVRVVSAMSAPGECRRGALRRATGEDAVDPQWTRLVCDPKCASFGRTALSSRLRLPGVQRAPSVRRRREPRTRRRSR